MTSGTDDNWQPSAGHAASGSSSLESNSLGRAQAMTVFSLLRPGGMLLAQLVLGLGRRRQPDTIRALSFIHFARLAIIRRFPDHDQDPEEIREPLLLFESNYDGTFGQYIDTFAQAIPRKMWAFWGSSYGFPGVNPVTPFKRYIRANEFSIDHYYSAYPEASTAMIGAALKLAGPHAEFHRRARTLTPEQFAREYRAFITEVQAEL
jgi:hypothetical protein